MKRVEFTRQAQRDFSAILAWYRANMGPRAALKVVRTINSKLRALSAGRLAGASASAPRSPYLRAVARKHVVIFLASEDRVRIVRIVHGAQDIEAIIAELQQDE